MAVSEGSRSAPQQPQRELVLPGSKEWEATLRSEAVRWKQKVDNVEVGPISREDGDLVLPLKDNPHADRVLFMLTTVGKSVFARAVGTVSGAYKSNILHGVRDGDKIVWDGEPDFKDDVSREDPRAFPVEGGWYLTYTRLTPNSPGFGVGLAVIDDIARPHEIREIGELIGVTEEGVDCKDTVILPEKVNGKVVMLVRFKPGIQAVQFDSMDDVIALAQDPGRRDEFWSRWQSMYAGGGVEAGKVDHLSPRSPEMRLWEARWSLIIRERINELLANFPDQGLYDITLDAPYWYGPGPAPLLVEKDGEKYWLGFPHRGQVIGELTEQGAAKKRMKNERLDSLKFYFVFSTLHRYDDPTKLVAVSPIPLSMPSVERYEQREHIDGVKNPLTSREAVPFVYILAGASREERHGKEKIFTPIGVNDVYTVLKWFNEKELVNWMLTHGKVEQTQ